MKNINLVKLTAIFLVTVTTLATGCKKATEQKLVDDLAGTYICYDSSKVTASGSGCPTDFASQYSMVVTKSSETSIAFSKLSYCDNVDANITGNNITIVSSSCPTIDPSLNPSVSRNGTTLNFTFSYNMGPCSVIGTIKAVKQ